MDGISLLTTIPYDNIRHLDWEHTQLIQHGDTLGQASRIWRGTHKGLRMAFDHESNVLRVKGSLQKYLKGNNYSGFTYREFAESVGGLADVLNCKPIDLAVINSEISATISHAPIHTRLKSLDNRPFINMVKPGTNKVYGAECLRTQRGAKVYDKSKAERLHRTLQPVPDNLVQVELSARRKAFYMNNGFIPVDKPTLDYLLLPQVYRHSYNLLIDMTKQIQIDSLIDWVYVVGKHGLSPSEVAKVVAMHDPGAAAFLKAHKYETWKKNKALYDRVKTDLSADAASTSEGFQQAVVEAVEQKFDG